MEAFIKSFKNLDWVIYCWERDSSVCFFEIPDFARVNIEFEFFRTTAPNDEIKIWRNEPLDERTLITRSSNNNNNESIKLPNNSNHENTSGSTLKYILRSTTYTRFDSFFFPPGKVERDENDRDIFYLKYDSNQNGNFDGMWIKFTFTKF